jgi:hypothetical protein
MRASLLMLARTVLTFSTPDVVAVSGFQTERAVSSNFRLAH